MKINMEIKKVYVSRVMAFLELYIPKIEVYGIVKFLEGLNKK